MTRGEQMTGVKAVERGKQLRRIGGLDVGQLFRIFRGSQRYTSADIMWILRELREFPPEDVFRAFRLNGIELGEILEGATAKTGEKNTYEFREIIQGLLRDVEAGYQLHDLTTEFVRRGLGTSELARNLRDMEVAPRDFVAAMHRTQGVSTREVLGELLKEYGVGLAEAFGFCREAEYGLIDVIKTAIEIGQEMTDLGAACRSSGVTAVDLGVAYKGRDQDFGELYTLLAAAKFEPEEVGEALAAAQFLEEIPSDRDATSHVPPARPAAAPTQRPTRPTPVAGSPTLLGTPPPPPAAANGAAAARKSGTGG